MDVPSDHFDGALCPCEWQDSSIQVWCFGFCWEEGWFSEGAGVLGLSLAPAGRVTVARLSSSVGFNQAETARILSCLLL